MISTTVNFDKVYCRSPIVTFKDNQSIERDGSLRLMLHLIGVVLSFLNKLDSIVKVVENYHLVLFSVLTAVSG